ncbi:hypothetical protein [Blastopirellula marina]|uniref:Uncharacterized protein n=1 Tax=Blastopirellula marina TaxID=124 RepID=A0A2S8FX36_9BACT|nr:hypothetical protein [Blastopirellula marina]PQO36630.1 hypothetical protein C5Y98_11585 [Blastopirellula marina]PTL44460.1 hypothetical protein C5Y97_11595 [Blastopirellula marina]
MAQTYLLKTPDGEVVHVETSQAGDTITTPSGKQVEVPTLSELKKLPLVQPEHPTIQRKWSLGQSIVLVIGLLVTFASLGSIIMFTLIFPTPLEKIQTELPQEVIEMIEGDIDSWKLEQMLDFWDFSTKSDVLDQMRSNGGYERFVSDTYQNRQMSLIGSIAGLIFGGILMGVSFILPGTKVE